MNSNVNCEAKKSMESVEQAEMSVVVGGVAPVWDAKGNMITCTDPRRWQSPGTLYPSPLRFPF
jgi:hypothetical protein